LEELVRTVSSAIEKEMRETRVPGRCPAEDALVLFTEGALPLDERTALSAHLAGCSRCREILALDTSAGTEDAAPVPAGVLADLVYRAKNLLDPAASGDVFDLVLSRVRDGLKVVHSGLRLLAPQGSRLALAAAVRTAGGSAGSSEPVRVEKPLIRYAAEVEVAPAHPDGWNIRVFLMDAERIATEPGLRVTLTDLDRGKELHSVMARQGTAVFHGLRSGDFGLEVRQRGGRLGGVSLRLL